MTYIDSIMIFTYSWLGSSKLECSFAAIIYATIIFTVVQFYWLHVRWSHQILGLVQFRIRPGLPAHHALGGGTLHQQREIHVNPTGQTSSSTFFSSQPVCFQNSHLWIRIFTNILILNWRFAVLSNAVVRCVVGLALPHLQSPFNPLP